MSSSVLATARPRTTLCFSIKLLLQGLSAAVVHILILKFSQSVWNLVMGNSPHYQLKFYWDGQKSQPNTEKIFFTINSFFLEVATQETLYLVAWSIMWRSQIFLSWDHSLRFMAIVSLKVLARGKPTSDCGLVLLYLMQISHFSSKSFIWDFSSSPFISQSCSKLNSLSKWVWKNCLWSFKPTLYFSILDKFCTLLQRNTTFDLNTF